VQVINHGGNELNGKRIAVAFGASAMALSLITGCGGKSAPKVGQNVKNVNQIQNQNEAETVKAYNEALKNVENQYPASQMHNPLELKMLRERDLYLNDESKIQYIYIFPSGRNEVFFSTVRGKVSSMTSQMTATDGIYLNNGSSNGSKDSQTIPMPQDDLSYGGSPCGDDGIFWFDEQGGYHQACVTAATVMIESSPLSLKAIEMPASAMPAGILAAMKKK
jgi:hypothetical protein